MQRLDRKWMRGPEGEDEGTSLPQPPKRQDHTHENDTSTQTAIDRQEQHQVAPASKKQARSNNRDLAHGTGLGLADQTNNHERELYVRCEPLVPEEDDGSTIMTSDIFPGAVHIAGRLASPQAVTTEQDSLVCYEDNQSIRDDTRTTMTASTNLIVADLAPDEGEIAARLAVKVRDQVREEVREQMIQEFGIRQAVLPPLAHAIPMNQHHPEGVDVPLKTNQNHPDSNTEQRIKLQMCQWSRHTWIIFFIIFCILVIIGIVVSVVVTWNNKKVSGNESGFAVGINNSNAPIPSTRLPTVAPTSHPTEGLTAMHASSTTFRPTSKNTTNLPTLVSTNQPTNLPTLVSTNQPTHFPTHKSTNQPTNTPTYSPTNKLTSSPTPTPTVAPTLHYTKREYLLKILGPYMTTYDSTGPSTYEFEIPTSPQYSALEWMANNDTFTSNPEKLSKSVLLERYVLALLYFSTSGYNWKNTRNIPWLSPTTICAWNIEQSASATLNPLEWDWTADAMSGGAYCNNNGSVVALEMYELGLVGILPWELSMLSNLNFLSLWTNNVTGTIPSEYSLLTSLGLLDVSVNQLTGQIPSGFGSLTNMIIMDFSENKFSGHLPADLGFLTQLRDLAVNSNKLSGTIPSEYFLLTNLVRLLVWDNMLTGTIPSELAKLTKLSLLDLGENQFSGQLPSDLVLMTDLTSLGVYSNKLTGNVPSAYSKFVNLNEFYFYYNYLTGSVNNIFCVNTNLDFSKLVADCPPQIQCNCCTGCY